MSRKSFRPVEQRTVLLNGGQSVVLNSTADGGGMGTIWVPERPVKASTGAELVVKIYKKPPSARQIEKLQGMVGYANSELLEWTAWPVALANDPDTKAVIGYFMPAFRDRVTLEVASKPKSLAREVDNPTWWIGATVATNLAYVISLLHASKIVFGDLNPKNFMVDLKTGNVCALDMDSVQIRSGNTIHYVDALHPYWRSPDLIDPRIGETEFTEAHDVFLLGMHIFRLLCYGNHPFAPVYEDKRDPDPLSSIKGRHYAYDATNAARHRIQPVPLAILPGYLSVNLDAMFTRTFLPRNEMPSAQEWHSFLLELVQERMEKCPKDRAHARLKGQSCGFCAMEGTVSTNNFKYYRIAKKKPMARERVS